MAGRRVTKGRLTKAWISNHPISFALSELSTFNSRRPWRNGRGLDGDQRRRRRRSGSCGHLQAVYIVRVLLNGDPPSKDGDCALFILPLSKGQALQYRYGSFMGIFMTEFAFSARIAWSESRGRVYANCCWGWGPSCSPASTDSKRSQCVYALILFSLS